MWNRMSFRAEAVMQVQHLSVVLLTLPTVHALADVALQL